MNDLFFQFSVFFAKVSLLLPNNVWRRILLGNIFFFLPFSSHLLHLSIHRKKTLQKIIGKNTSNQPKKSSFSYMHFSLILVYKLAQHLFLIQSVLVFRRFLISSFYRYFIWLSINMAFFSDKMYIKLSCMWILDIRGFDSRETYPANYKKIYYNCYFRQGFYQKFSN